MTTAARQALVAVRVALRLAGGFVALAWFAALLPGPRRERMIGRWCRGALSDLGIALQVHGEPVPAAACLVVSNHVSWVDTLALRAAVPCGFVAKHSLRGWPVVGRLIALSGGVFLHREKPSALPEAVGRMAACLGAGRSVCVFPEATTTTGRSVAPFFPAAFEACARASVPVLPVALRYLEDGQPSPRAAWVGDEAFLPSLLRIAAGRRLSVQVVVGSPVPAGAGRAATAAAARAVVASLGALALADSAFVHPPGGRVACPGGHAARVAAAVVEWLARRPQRPPRHPEMHSRLVVLGVDSLEVVALLAHLETLPGLQLDAAQVELPLDPTLGELVAAVARCCPPGAVSLQPARAP